MKLQAGLLLALVSVAGAWTAANFPDPLKDPPACGRDVTGWVCSPDKLVKPDSLAVIEGTIRAIHKGIEPYKQMLCVETGQSVPSEIFVAAVKKVDGSGSKAQRVEEFARGLHDRFGVGTCGSGVVLVISVDDRQAYISVGSLAKQHLTPGRIQNIIHNIKPFLVRHAYDVALERATVQIGLSLSDARQPGGGEGGDSDEGQGPWWAVLVPLGLFASVSGFSLWRGHRGRRQTREATRHLRRLQADIKASKQGKYVATSCPICLTDFADSEAEAVPAGAVATSTAVDSPRLADGGAATEADALLGQASTSAEQGGSLRRRVRSRDLEGAASRGGKPPFLLPCGHSFCEPCIMRWLDGHAECPICRKPASPDDAAVRPRRPSRIDRPELRPDPHQRPPSPPHYSGNCNGIAGILEEAELAFRLWQLHNMYPHVVTHGMVSSLSSAAADGQDLDWESHPDFIAQTTQAVQQERAEWGSTNTGASLGGGHSSGGGGGGW